MDGDVIKCDARDNVIYFKDGLTGDETWTEFDEHSRWIHNKKSNGFETWKTYDDENHIAHYKTSEGFERISTRAENGNLESIKTVVGFQDFKAFKNEEIYSLPKKWHKQVYQLPDI
jgi:hypothetical protein